MTTQSSGYAPRSRSGGSQGGGRVFSPLNQEAQLLQLANRQRKLNKEAEERLIKKAVRQVLKDS